MRRVVFFFFLCALVLAAGCETLQPVARMPFPEDEYVHLPAAGTGCVRGQAFLRTRGGDVKLAAGSIVSLNPVTSYSEQWYAAYMENRPLEPREPDPRLEKYIRETIADGDGRFEFADVPAGDYFVTTTVIWEAPVGYRGSLVPQGGLVTKRITIADGSTVQVVLTR